MSEALSKEKVQAVFLSLAFAGGVGLLSVHAAHDFTLWSESEATPARMTCAELIAGGVPKNRYVRVTECRELGWVGQNTIKRSKTGGSGTAAGGEMWSAQAGAGTESAKSADGVMAELLVYAKDTGIVGAGLAERPVIQGLVMDGIVGVPAWVWHNLPSEGVGIVAGPRIVEMRKAPPATWLLALEIFGCVFFGIGTVVVLSRALGTDE